MAKYWVGDSGDWSDSAHWSLSSGGIGGDGEPDNTEDVIIDSNSFTLSSQALTVSQGSDCKTFTTTGVLHAPTLTLADSEMVTARLSLNGDMTLDGSMGIVSENQDFPGQLSWDIAGTLITAGLTLNCDIYVPGTDQKLTLGDNLTLSDGMNLEAGDGGVIFGSRTFTLNTTTTRGRVFVDSTSELGTATFNIGVGGTAGAFVCDDTAIDPVQSTINLNCETNSKAALFNTHNEPSAIERVNLNNVIISGTCGAIGTQNVDSAIVGGWHFEHLTILPSTKLFLRDQGPES